MDQIIRKKSRKKVSNSSSTAWIFDLDNTLYPEHCNLFAHIDVKMKAYITNLLGVDGDQAYKIQKDYFIRYGTTLRGLIEVHGVNPEDFMHFVHDIDLSPLKQDQELDRALSEIRGRKFIFTNGEARYATRVLEKIGIEDQFDGIFDIAAAGHIPKPNEASYQNFIDHFGIDPKNAVMIEDMARNLAPAAALGMTTVWVKTRYEWGAMGYDAAHIDYETDHLADWLSETLQT